MRLGRKLLAIGGLILLLLIPIALLHGLVDERQQRAAGVVADIAQASANAQRITAPLLRLEIERVVRRMERVGNDERVPLQAVDRTEVETLLVAADAVDVTATLGTETRQRGLFEARIFQQKAQISARFRVPTPVEVPGQQSVRLRDARWVLGLGDNRGITALGVRAQGRALQPEPGTGVAWLPEGVQAVLPGGLVGGEVIETAAALDLTGTSQLAWLPVAEDFRWQLAGDWPHPRFAGFALPIEREVRADGFRAEWRLSSLASQAPQRLAACGPEALCPGLEATAVSLELLDPVDRYLMTDRAMKYALLFLGLVFGAVFLLEVLRGAAVHPLHYLLVGLALALFFLLLLALAEHVGFGLAYALAAGACIALIGYYLSGVLGGARRGLGLAALLGALYGALYGLLQSEDHALLLGAVLLFGTLAATMVLTRRIDWARLGAAPPPVP
ncbi:cell envelope integrity protein CreD [Silanimonas algicola]